MTLKLKLRIVMRFNYIWNGLGSSVHNSVDIVEETTRPVELSKLDARMGRAFVKLGQHAVGRAETHDLGLVKSLLEENRRTQAREIVAENETAADQDSSVNKGSMSVSATHQQEVIGQEPMC
ncbi:hypothetical protein P3T76_012010 [Phytophthora citrophthora]|uniref:Uncharacterized protein n=1 Tax=Phytophthora citrophthora TaxID=4793 RepID=A0AAD9G5W8_9STRA|nr:hypothetical protein P3T76_012010 [Phytophthora citrophthora]